MKHRRDKKGRIIVNPTSKEYWRKSKRDLLTLGVLGPGGLLGKVFGEKLLRKKKKRR